MRIEIYDDSQKELWDEFVRNSKNGTFLFMRDYMDYHRDRFDDHSLIIWNKKRELIALLPANRDGNRLTSHGGLTYGGFITNHAMKTSTMLEVFEHTLAYLKKQSFTKFIYKTVPYIYHKIPAEEDRYALFLCNASLIRRDVLTIVDSRFRLPFQQRRRRGVKKAVKNGLSVGHSDKLESYWDILEETLARRHKARPVHTLEEIELLHARFQNKIKLFTCFKDAVMLAGVLIYESEKVAHVQYIAANEQGKYLGALDLIFNYLLTSVYTQKPFFDFGISNENNGRYLNKGLIDQKEGFGARAVVHDFYEINLSA